MRRSGRHYVKEPTPCDNWLWAPLGVVDVHQPERWGYLQFSDRPVNTSRPVKDPDFAVRSVAMQVYYAEHAYAAAHNGSFTDDVASLGAYVPLGGEALRCAKSVAVTARGGPASGFTASVTAKGSGRVATVTDDRLLLVRDPHQN